MIFKSIITEKWNKGSDSIRLDNVYVESVKKLSKDEKASGWITKKSAQNDSEDKDYTYIGNARHEFHTGKPNALLYHRKAYLKTLDETGAVQYVALYTSRVPFLILLLFVIIAALCCCVRQKPAEPEKPISTEDAQGQKDLENETTNPEVHAVGSITYTSPNVNNCTWKADTKEQEFTIVNPTGNTDDLAPHIYVDLDGNGEFADDECVFNPITYDENGEAVSYGGFIAPGKQIDKITLTKKIPAGKYDAKIAYTAVDISTKTLDNPMVFDFTVTVE